MIVVILGMHRSGTSFLSQTLQGAGMVPVGDALNEVAADNLTGHWEACDVVRINDRILELSGGSWDAVPEPVVSDDAVEARIVEYVARLREHPVSGWKDPRTTLTYPIWRTHLPEHTLIGAVRHPVRVAESLRTRQGWPLEKSLALWADYNERLLRIADEREVLWFDFDAAPERIAADVRAVCGRIGLAIPNAEIFNEFLRHHESDADCPDARAAGIYRQLRERIDAARTGAAATQNAEASAAEADADAPQRAAGTGAAGGLRRMGEAVRLQNLALQGLVQRLAALEYAAKDGRAEAVETALAGLSHHLHLADGRARSIEALVREVESRLAGEAERLTAFADTTVGGLAHHLHRTERRLDAEAARLARLSERTEGVVGFAERITSQLDGVAAKTAAAAVQATHAQALAGVNDARIFQLAAANDVRFQQFAARAEIAAASYEAQLCELRAALTVLARHTTAIRTAAQRTGLLPAYRAARSVVRGVRTVGSRLAGRRPARNEVAVAQTKPSQDGDGQRRAA